MNQLKEEEKKQVDIEQLHHKQEKKEQYEKMMKGKRVVSIDSLNSYNFEA